MIWCPTLHLAGCPAAEALPLYWCPITVPTAKMILHLTILTMTEQNQHISWLIKSVRKATKTSNNRASLLYCSCKNENSVPSLKDL